MDGRFSEPRLLACLQDVASAQNLDYLAYVLVPQRGGEGLMVEVGQPPGGLHSRGVECLIGSGARSELHWIPGDAYSSGKAEALLRELASYGLQSTLAERLHGTICQSLTAAHLHLELGLMTTPDAPEEFALARQLVHDATVSVRELMDELAGETT